MTEAVALIDIASWLDAYLDPNAIDDYGPNGLQVEACQRVRTVVTGVTANLALIEAAAAAGADLLLVHHGLYWTGAAHTVTGALGARVRALIGAGLSLAAYHLPLDGHLEVGNAATLARAIGLQALAPAFVHRGIAAGVVGCFPHPLSADAVRTCLEAEVSDRTLLFAHGPAEIRTAGVLTGGAPRDVREAIDRGLDLYITGEAGEYSQATAAEEGIHFAACGHHRSERFGPRALGERLAAEFPALSVRFIDVDNPA